MTAPRTGRPAALYALRTVEPWNFILGLFVLFVVQVVAVTGWRLLVNVERLHETLAGPVQPFAAAMACSVCAFITTVLSRPQNGKEGLAVFGVALLSAGAVAVGVIVAALAAQTAVPRYSDSILVQAFVACAGFWTGTPVIFGSMAYFGLHPLDDQADNGRANLKAAGMRAGGTIARPDNDR